MTTTFYVGNLPYDLSDHELRSFFEFGGFTVTRVKICTDRETQKARGFGFVDISGDASTVIESLNGESLGGRDIRIRDAIEKQNSRRTESRSDTDLL